MGLYAIGSTCLVERCRYDTKMAVWIFSKNYGQIIVEVHWCLMAGPSQYLYLDNHHSVCFIVLAFQFKMIHLLFCLMYEIKYTRFSSQSTLNTFKVSQIVFFWLWPVLQLNLDHCGPIPMHHTVISDSLQKTCLELSLV